MNLDALLDRARRIESETTDAANTARRVGSLLADLIGALRSISDDSLSSLVDDEARGHIIFARGLTSEAATHLDGGVQVGQGAASVDASGHGTLQSLVLREWLEVPELRLNRTAIHLGASLLSPGAGIVAEVEVDADARGGHVTLKLEAGEAASVVEGDLLMGIFSAPNAEWGAVRDADNGRLDVQFAGFATAYFEVAALDADRRGFRYTLRPDTHVHPRRFMTFASRGNRHDAARGKFCFSTRSYTRYLSGVQSWDITASHVVLQLGELDTLRPLGFSAEVGGVGLYAENAFLSGCLRVGGGFKTADEIVEDQTLHIEYSHDGIDDWHSDLRDGDRFMRQRKGSGAWSEAAEFAAKPLQRFYIDCIRGSTSYRAGQGFIGRFRAVLEENNIDITHTLHPSRIKWTRESEGDDEYWALAHANTGFEVDITTNDIAGHTALVCTLYQPDGLVGSKDKKSI